MKRGAQGREKQGEEGCLTQRRNGATGAGAELPRVQVGMPGLALAGGDLPV
jgi:hypothetical protein